MTRRKPFTNADIAERSTWPETKAALRGPDSYDELGILNPTQRRELVTLAHVAPDREKLFVRELLCVINGYRLRKRRHAQETPAAVAASIRQLIRVVTAYARDVAKFPDYVICELKPPLPSVEWFKHADEKLRQKERWLKGHRSTTLTEPLIMYAWTLQKLAGTYSSRLASDWPDMKRWLGQALIASGERLPGKNSETAYFEGLMLPRAGDGSVELTGRPPAFIALAE
jgi:hypothetical protein